MEDFTTSQWYFTYDEVITKAQAIQPHFAADLPQFTAFDEWYSSAVNAEILSAIDRGLKEFSETQWVAQIKQTSDQLDLHLIDAIYCYETLTFYLFHGFGFETTMHETVGYSHFPKARHSIRKMVALLKLAIAAIAQEDIKTRLLAAGMPPSLPLELAFIAAAMAVGYGELKQLKKQHLHHTRERIALFNSLWDTLTDICEDAKIIFAHDSLRLENYDLFEPDDWSLDNVEIIHLN